MYINDFTKLKSYWLLFFGPQVSLAQKGRGRWCPEPRGCAAVLPAASAPRETAAGRHLLQ